MSKELKKGDKVEWETSQGKTQGTIKKKLTKPTDIKNHHVAATENNPEFLVETRRKQKAGGAQTGISKKS